MKHLRQLAGFGAVLSAAVLQAAEKPNVIYIFTDQQTATAMSCAGNKDLRTPNMDRLAARGVMFSNAYCGSPLSGPSRAAMFTGHSPHEIGQDKNGFPLPDSVKTQSLGFLMGKAGYECTYAGKWHVHSASMPDEEFGFHTIHPHNDIGLAEACAKYLEGKHRKPFFLTIGFDNPHNICEYARQQNLPWGNIEAPNLNDCPGLPANFARQPYDADVVAYEQTQNHSAYPTINYSPDDWRRYRYTYFRLVEKVDAEIGKVLDALDKMKLWDDTIVIFSSDHGDGTGAHHWNQKSALYEEVVNIPLIVVLPGQKNAGAKLPQLINNGVDFFASICDWADIVLPDGLHGVSFRPLVEKADPAIQHQEYVVTETLFDKGSGTRGWALRTERYKYVIYDKGLYREQLFDMDSDRGEMRNLAMEAECSEILDRHRSLLNDWMRLHKTRQLRPGLNIVPGY